MTPFVSPSSSSCGSPGAAPKGARRESPAAADRRGRRHGCAAGRHRPRRRRRHPTAVDVAATPWPPACGRSCRGASRASLFLLPAVLEHVLAADRHDRVVIYCWSRSASACWSGGSGMFSLCQIVLVGRRRLGRAAPQLRTDAARSRPHPHRRAGHRRRSASSSGLPALRLSGLYLALITLMAAGAITLLLLNVKFPNSGSGFSAIRQSRRRRRRCCRDRRSPRATRLLPLLRGRGRDHVPRRRVAHPGQARAGVGGDPPERGHGGRRRRQHHAVQAVGVRLVGVHHRRRRRLLRRGRAASPSTSSRSRRRSSCSPSC